MAQLVVNAGADTAIAVGGSTAIGGAPTASGGTGPYSYDWNNGAPDVEDPTGLPAGLYTLTVTDARGCKFTLSGVTVSEPAQKLTVWITGKTDANCQGGSAKMVLYFFSNIVL